MKTLKDLQNNLMKYNMINVMKKMDTTSKDISSAFELLLQDNRRTI